MEWLKKVVDSKRMTPATKRGPGESKDCLRVAAAPASTLLGAGPQRRSLLIERLCQQWGESRKHAIRLLIAKTGWGVDPGLFKGRPPKYDTKVEEVLWRIWMVAE